jgi:ATP-dependent helicase/nuclease subunit A
VVEYRDHADRERAVHALDTSLLVEAGAGTGKTTTMVRRIVALLTEPAQPGIDPLRLSQIVAITFTERAAEELKDRLRAELYRELTDADGVRAERVSDALNDLEFAPVGTIHSFCSTILRRYPIDAGVDVQYAVMDERESTDLRLEVWHKWLVSEIRGNEHPDVMSCIIDYGISISTIQDFAFRLLGLRADDAAELLAQTVSEPINWAQEIAELDHIVTRFESGDQEILDTYDIRKPNRNIVAKMRRFIQRITEVDGLERHAILLASLSFESSKAAPPLLDRINPLRARISGPIIAGLAKWIGRPDGFIETYRREMVRRGAIDFDDLLIVSRDLVRDRDDVRCALRKEYRTFIVDEFQDTDPVQAELICRLSQESDSGADWSRAPIERGCLCVVGDPKQSIYRFRGANIDTYASVAEMIGSDARCSLHTNFRSHPEIIRAVNDIFQQDGMFRRSDVEDRSGGTYQATNHMLEPSFSSDDVDGSEPTKLRVQVISDGEERATHSEEGRIREGAVVAATIREMVDEGRLVRDPVSKSERPVRFGDFALLYRSASNVALYEEALRGADIPYYRLGGTDYYNREEIVRLISTITAIDQPGDKLAVVAALRSVFFGVSDADLVRAVSACGGVLDYRIDPTPSLPDTIAWAFATLCELHKLRLTARPSSVVQALYDRTGVMSTYAQAGNSDQAMANLMKALDDIRQIEADGPVSFRRLSDRLRYLRSTESDESDAGFDADEPGERAQLLTIHKAKGLEFPVVCLIDSGAAPPTGRNSSSQVLTDFHTPDAVKSVGVSISGDDLKLKTKGFNDIALSDKNRDEAESIRLLYVALTRARDYLILPSVSKQAPTSWSMKIGPAIDFGDWTEFKTITPTKPIPLTATSTGTIGDYTEMRAELVSRRKMLQREADSPTVVYQRPSHHDSHRTAVDHDVYHLVEEHTDANQDEAADRDVRQRLGTAVHAALERLTPGSQRHEIEKCAQHALAESNFDPVRDADFSEYLTTVVELASRGLASELVGRAFSAKEMWREAPVTLCEQPEGGLLHVTRGICDLVFREDNGLVIVDYKTDRIGETQGNDIIAKTDGYASQINLYVRALEAATGMPVLEAWLLFLAAGDQTVAQAVAISRDTD